MLKIQEFINEHENWKELLSVEPYNLKISEENGFYLFKYNQIESDFGQEICREARGLILDSTNNFKVVRLAFCKFFNLGEKYAAEINWNTATSSEKIDGSLMSVWYSHGEWHLSTNGTINAFTAELHGVTPYNTFGELFESVLPLCVFKGNRWENLCFTFELVSPFNRVVIEYPDTKLYLLSVRRMDTLEEITDQHTLYEIASTLHVERPKVYELNNQKDYEELVASMDDSHEGIVVCDDKFNRVKIKTLHYFELHKMAHNGNVPLETIVDLVRTNETDEFLAYFSQYRDAVDRVKAQVDAVYEAVEIVSHDVENWKLENPVVDLRENRKAFALWVQAQDNLPVLYYQSYDSGNAKTFVDELTNAKFIKMFNIS